MIKNNIKEKIGSLKISQDVIFNIANIAANEINGVSSVVCSSTCKSIFNFKKNLPARNIKVNISNDSAVIDVFIKVKYNVKIQQVSQLIQHKVKDAVQSITGIAISKVNVHITDIDFSDEQTNDEPNMDNKDVE